MAPESDLATRRFFEGLRHHFASLPTAFLDGSSAESADGSSEAWAAVSDAEVRRTLENPVGTTRRPASGRRPLVRQIDAQNNSRAGIAKSGEIRRETPFWTPHGLDSDPQILLSALLDVIWLWVTLAHC